MSQTTVCGGFAHRWSDSNVVGSTADRHRTARVRCRCGRVASSVVAGSAHDRARTEFGFSGGFLPSAAPRPIDASTAVVTFLGAWVVAQLVSSVILAVLAVAASVGGILSGLGQVATHR